MSNAAAMPNTSDDLAEGDDLRFELVAEVSDLFVSKTNDLCLVHCDAGAVAE
jgi:hypothetical protein